MPFWAKRECTVTERNRNHDQERKDARMKKRQWIAGILSGLFLTAVLTGCAAKEDETLPPTSQAAPTVPSTGDHSHVELWIGALCLCALGFAAVLAAARRRRSGK